VKHLWAPWRIQYIKGPAPEACIFCLPPAAGDDRARHIVYRGRLAFVILNAFPYNAGHLMIVPNRHVADLGLLDDGETLELMRLAAASMAAIRDVYAADGFNIGVNVGRAAGAGILDHVHLHVVPRWVGDTNFMPVLGDVKVLPEDLSVTRDRLSAALRAVLAAKGIAPP
jgi:ATP adenylyltransferase